MKKTNRQPEAVVLFLAAMLLATPALADPTLKRQSELLYFIKHDCGSCHGLTRKGGLGSPLLPEVLAGRDDSDLAGIILDGLPGTPMPPWRGLLKKDEALWMVQVLKDGKW